jgi:signal transduction histidine kinase
MVDTMKDVPPGEGRWFEYYWLGMTRLGYMERVVDSEGVSYFLGSSYNPTADREAAVELVKRGYQFMKAHGRTSIVDAINDQTQRRFKLGNLTLFIYDYKGVPIAYGSNTALVGKNLIDLKDESGRYMVREILDKAKNEGAGWLDFRWRKSFFSMYVEDIDLGSERFVIGTGVYPLTKESTMVLMVKSAKGFFKMNNNEDAFREFVDPKSTFIRGDMGIFVIDTDGICYADRDRFDLIWKDLSEEKDDDGKLYFKAMISAAKMGPAKVMYKKNNARKVAYIETVKKGDKTFIIGSSFYP